MRIDVEGEGNIRVAQEFLDVLDVDALPQEERGARVPEVLKAEARPSFLVYRLQKTLQIPI